MNIFNLNLVSFPDPSRIHQEGVWQHVIHCCVQKEIQSLTQSRVNVYTHGDNWRCSQLHAVVLVRRSSPYWIIKQYQFCAWCGAMRHYPVSGEYSTEQTVEYNGR